MWCLNHGKINKLSSLWNSKKASKSLNTTSIRLVYWWESLGSLFYLAIFLFILGLGLIFSFVLVPYWLWWELSFVWGLYKAKTCSRFGSSVDLEKFKVCIANKCFVIESLHGDVQSGKEISLVLKPKSNMYALLLPKKIYRIWRPNPTLWDARRLLPSPF